MRPWDDEADVAWDRLDHHYLLACSPGAVRRHVLPHAGRLVIGRSRTCDLLVEDPGVSRRHLELEVTGDLVTARDLGSRHGTSLNQSPMHRTRELRDCDVLALGAATFVFRAGRPRQRAALVDVPSLRERVDIEAARSARNGRFTAVMWLRLEEPGPPLAAVLAALRAVDAAAWMAPSDLAVVLPEVLPGDAHVVARRLLGALCDVGCEARLGVALSAVDGDDFHSLVQAALVAAGRAPPGTVQLARGAAPALAVPSLLGDGEVTGPIELPVELARRLG